MKKIMLSQLMKGKTSEEITKEIELAKQYLDAHFNKVGEKYEVLNTYYEKEYLELKESGRYSENNLRIKMLAKSIDAMAEADYLVMIGNWFAGAGCGVEHTVASNYKKPKLYVEFELGYVFTESELHDAIDSPVDQYIASLDSVADNTEEKEHE